MNTKPFMEHPTGKYTTAIEAMEEAISRLRSLPAWTQWITFCAQGEGESPESIHSAQVRLLSDILDVGSPVDLAQITAYAKVNRGALTPAGGTTYSIAAATPKEAAQILDALFRYHLGVRPFLDEDNDYAVGAEW